MARFTNAPRLIFRACGTGLSVRSVLTYNSNSCTSPYSKCIHSSWYTMWILYTSLLPRLFFSSGVGIVERKEQAYTFSKCLIYRPSIVCIGFTAALPPWWARVQPLHRRKHASLHTLLCSKHTTVVSFVQVCFSSKWRSPHYAFTIAVV